MAHEFDGDKYAKASAHQREWGAKLIAELNLTGNEHVLDLGCGDGANTAAIADLLPDGRVLGIDASRGMIAAAKPKEKTHLQFTLMDINAIAFEEAFDVVYSNATLHWVKDHRRLLANVHQALRPGGVVRFNFAGDGNCANFFKVIRKAMQTDAFAADFKAYAWPWYMPTVDAYAQLAGQSGLKDVRVWGENADRHFPDAEAMIGWLDQPSLVPFMAWLPDSKKAAFRDFVIERMVEQTRQHDGRCFETFRRINLLARK